MEQAALQAEALVVRDNLGEQLGQSLACLTDPARHQGHALLHRKYSLTRALLALLWPGLMLGGGALLIALVKLTQQLGLVHRELGRRGPEDRSLHVQT